MKTIEHFRSNKKLCEIIKAVLEINPEAICRIDTDLYPTAEGYISIGIWNVAGYALDTLWREMVPGYPLDDEMIDKVDFIDFSPVTDKVPYGSTIDITDLGRCQ